MRSINIQYIKYIENLKKSKSPTRTVTGVTPASTRVENR
jgi:hypothetical protein